MCWREYQGLEVRSVVSCSKRINQSHTVRKPRNPDSSPDHLTLELASKEEIRFHMCRVPSRHTMASEAQSLPHLSWELHIETKSSRSSFSEVLAVDDMRPVLVPSVLKGVMAKAPTNLEPALEIAPGLLMSSFPTSHT